MMPVQRIVGVYVADLKTLWILYLEDTDQSQSSGERQVERSCKEAAATECSKEDFLQAAKRAKPLCQHPSQKEEGLQS